MKNKILIFIFCIITFGLFAIPLTFASNYSVENLNYINRVKYVSIVGGSNNRIDLDVDISDFSNTSYWYITFQAFDSNFNLIEIPNSNHKVYYITGGTSTTKSMGWTSNNGNPFSYANYSNGLTTSSLFSSLHIYLDFLSSNDLNYFNQSVHYYQVLIERNNANNLIQPFIYDFIPNEYYNFITGNGFFNGVNVELGYTGTNRFTNVNNYMLGYNNISFGAIANEVATNNSRNSNQYYLRVHFNKYINQMVNLDLSYLEITGGKLSGTYYTKNQLMQVLPILSTNITLYNDNTKLFQTDELYNSSYANLFLEYIDFDICNYTFTTSTYYNSTLGVLGYIEDTHISAMSISNTQAYREGVDKGFSDGYLDGYNDGYQKAYSDKGNDFDDLFFAVGNVPMTIISSVLNFEILGFNLLGFFMGIITLVLFVKIIRKFKE